VAPPAVRAGECAIHPDAVELVLASVRCPPRL